MSGVPQRLVLGLLNVFTSNVDRGTKCTFSRFADNTKLCGAVDTMEGRDNTTQGPVRTS